MGTELQIKLHKVKGDLLSITEVKEALVMQLDESQCENESLSGELREINKKLDALQSENETLTVELSETWEKLGELQNENEAKSKKESEALLSKIDSLQHEKETVESNLTGENKKLLRTLRETKKSFEVAANQTAILEKQKEELEKKLSQELLETKGDHSDTILRLKAHIEDTEMALDNVKNDKDARGPVFGTRPDKHAHVTQVSDVVRREEQVD